MHRELPANTRRPFDYPLPGKRVPRFSVYLGKYIPIYENIKIISVDYPQGILKGLYRIRIKDIITIEPHPIVRRAKLHCGIPCPAEISVRVSFTRPRKICRNVPEFFARLYHGLVTGSIDKAYLVKDFPRGKAGKTSP
jgi:hypothetical protein